MLKELGPGLMLIYLCKPKILAELFNYRLRVEAGMKLIQMNGNS
jgi:hypothetical protein